MTVRIDCADICTKDQLHDALAQALKLPDWYGRNMDALLDCLTELSAPTELQLYNTEPMDHALGYYARVLRIVLRRASEENPRLQVSFCEED